MGDEIAKYCRIDKETKLNCYRFREKHNKINAPLKL